MFVQLHCQLQVDLMNIQEQQPNVRLLPLVDWQQLARTNLYNERSVCALEMSDALLFGMSVDILALVVAIIAILITLLKDFILPWIFKPKLIFGYEEKPHSGEKM